MCWATGVSISAAGLSRGVAKFFKALQPIQPPHLQSSVRTDSPRRRSILGSLRKPKIIGLMPTRMPNVSSALFFKYNTVLGPLYRVIVDTNFINFSIQNKLDFEKAMMDCLYAKCTPCITDCVMAELEKLGQKYRVALRCALKGRLQKILLVRLCRSVLMVNVDMRACLFECMNTTRNMYLNFYA
ncbi:uncharacterized protein [Spinacia oleracea]|uniref:PIN domain-containing protein n=1 Tax=Spinacia oleracea TaxID=3562 RepID=A0ABM3R3Y6_SPIOL|nr:uncharacterized protein LOC130465534 [Spinacia oleracea]